jgi:hypothetical protein
VPSWLEATLFQAQKRSPDGQPTQHKPVPGWDMHRDSLSILGHPSALREEPGRPVSRNGRKKIPPNCVPKVGTDAKAALPRVRGEPAQLRPATATERWRAGV